MEMNVCWCITPINVVLQVLQNSSEFKEMCVLALSVISKENYPRKTCLLKGEIEHMLDMPIPSLLILFHEKSASCKRKCFTKGHEYKTWWVRQDSKFTEDPVLDNMLPHTNLCKRVSWYISMVYTRKRFKLNTELCHRVRSIFLTKEHWEFLDKDCL